MSGIYGQLGLVKEVGANGTVTGITAVAGAPNTGNVAVTAHGYRAGDVITFAGFTPAGWNGSFAVMSVTNANVFVISTGATVVASSSIQGTITLATKFGGGGTVTRFFEFVSETLKFDRLRVVSNALTFNRYTKRSDRFAPYGAGGSGDILLEVQSKGFAYLLGLLFGTVVQTGPSDTTAYTYTATRGSLLGQSMAVQVGRPFSISQIVQPFNYLGVKIDAWSLDNAVDGILLLKLTCSFQNEVVNVALAVPSYPSGTVELLTFAGGSMTLAGTAVATVKTISISGKNGLTPAADRRFINAGGLPAEMLQNAWEDIQWSAMIEFTDMTAYNRYISTTAAGTMASLVALWTAPTLITGAAATFPSLQITLPNARTDTETPTVGGPQLLTMKLSGPALDTNSTAEDAITAVYVTGDSSP